MGIAKVLGIRNRGVKTESSTARGKIGILNVKGTNVLLEICFMSNPSDHLAYQNKKAELASYLSGIIVKEFKS
jgi:N-acetylmuramoyl-L-alanine amidase